MAQKYASWAAKDTREAGSLPSDFDGAISAAQFTKEAPDGYQADGNPIFAVISILQPEVGPLASATAQERTITQSYSLGAKAGDEFTISDDGFGLIPTDDSIASIRRGTKFDLLKCSLENEGVSQAITGQGDLSKLIGINGHWRRVDDDKLLGKARDFKDDKKAKSKFPPQTLVMTKLLGMPGEKTSGNATASAGNSGATSGGTGVSSPAADLESATVGFLIDVLGAAKDNTVQRSQLIPFITKAAIKHPQRTDIARMAADEGFLQRQVEAGLVKYDASAKPQTVSMAA